MIFREAVPADLPAIVALLADDVLGKWLLRHPDDPRAAGIRDELDARLRDYVGVYRGILGLAYLVLGR
jgi:hypothetical protein